MIKIIVVEHLKETRELMVQILKSDSDINVIGQFDNADLAIEALKKEKPDLLIMDLELTKPSALAATRKIMETTPLPIVIVSSIAVTNTFNTLEAGAVAVIEKPDPKSKNYEKSIAKFLKTIKLMSVIKVVKRIPLKKHTAHVSSQETEIVNSRIPCAKIIVIGASTGGPVVLEQILSGLPDNFQVPISVVQHIAGGFTDGMVKWLNTKSVIPVSIAKNNSLLEPGNCYIAPEGLQMKINKQSRIQLTSDPPENNLIPSISVLFRSVAENIGKESIGILLTGMGKDGAEELKLMREKGAVTIAQDKDSSLIFGMPGEAIKIGAAVHIFNPGEIISFLQKIGK